MRIFIAATLVVLNLVIVRAAAPDPLATLHAGHPRLLATEVDFARIRQAAAKDPLQAQVNARIIEIADANLNAPPIQHRLIGPRLLDQSRLAIARILDRSMAYRLTGDKKYADAAKREMETAAAFADWNPSHFLDVAEMSFALAIGYDWLFDQLTPTERADIKKALLEKSLVFAPAAYAPGGPTDKRVWFVTAHHNWNQVCNGGLLAASLALADEEPATARTVLAGVQASLPLAMHAYIPDGAYPEGPGYWAYGTSYNVFILSMLETALGNDYGLGKAAAFDRTALYRLAIQAPSGLGFNYADGGAGLEVAPVYTWLATRYGPTAALAHSRSLLAARVSAVTAAHENDRFFALHALWLPADHPVDAANQPPLDLHFRGGADIAVFRSKWNDPQAIFLGFKAGDNATNHSHLDLGSFVLEADGVRWAVDLGPDNYNLPGYFDTKAGGQRWTYFRLNNFSHNVVTPGAALQEAKAVAPLIAFGSTADRAFAVADLSKVYPGHAKSVSRGMALLERKRVLVEDEIEQPAQDETWTWSMTTGANVTLLDAHSARLSAKGKTLRVDVLSPAKAQFSVRPAKPSSADENQNAGIQLLEAKVKIPAGETARIGILLTPVERQPGEQPAPAVIPLARWSDKPETAVR